MGIYNEIKVKLDNGEPIDPVWLADGAGAKWPTSDEEVDLYARAFAKATGQTSFQQWQRVMTDYVQEAGAARYPNTPKMALELVEGWNKQPIGLTPSGARSTKWDWSLKYLKFSAETKHQKTEAMVNDPVGGIQSLLFNILPTDVAQPIVAEDRPVAALEGSWPSPAEAMEKDLADALEKINEGTGAPNLGGGTTPEEISEADLVNLKQCALLSNLPAFAEQHKKAFNNTDGSWNNGGRVLSFTDDDPENTVNMFTTKQTMSLRGMLPTSLINLTSHYFHVFKVSDDGSEHYIPRTLGTGTAESVSSLDMWNSAGTNTDYTGGAVDSTLNSYLTLKSAKISYEGGTPATNRNDVTVDLTYQFKSLEMLSLPFLLPAQVDIGKTDSISGTNYAAVSPVADSSKVEFKLSDLITVPAGISNSSGIGKVFKRQYDPGYGRIRIKFGSFFQKSDLSKEIYLVAREYIKESENELLELTTKTLEEAKKTLETLMFKPCELDLALVDHELKLQEDGNKDHWELVISYRGYMQTLLTSPIFDCLKTNQEIRDIKKREADLVEKAVDADCSYMAITELYRSFNSYLDEMAMRGPAQLLERLILQGKMYKTKIRKTDLKAILNKRSEKGTAIAWPLDYDFAGVVGNALINNAKKTSDKPFEDGVSTTIKLTEKELNETAYASTGLFSAEAIDTVWSHYFYVGDLIAVATDCVFQTGEFHDTIDPEIFGEDVRFITTAFKHLHDGKTHKINLANVPIDVYFFYSWFHETVIKKKRKSYPIAAFIRDLCEVAISNLLSEVCFGPSLEAKLHFSTSFIGPCPQLKFRPAVEEGANLPGPAYSCQEKSKNWNKPVFKLFKPDNLKTKDTLITNYFIVYCMNQNYFSKTNDGSHESLHKHNVPYIPFGARNYYGYAKKVTLSKTNNPGLREARFYNSSQNPLTILSNVYNVSITTREATCAFYPGMLFYLDPVDLTNSSAGGGGPSTLDSIAYVTGIGGYHICTKATIDFTNLDQLTVDATETINGIWVYSGTDSEIRMPGKEKQLGEPPETLECRQLLLEVPAQRVHDLEKQRGDAEAERKSNRR